MNDRASDTDQDALGAALGILQWLLSYTHKRRLPYAYTQPSGWSNHGPTRVNGEGAEFDRL